MDIGKIAEVFKNELEVLPGFVKYCYFFSFALLALLLAENNLNLFSTGLGRVLLLATLLLLTTPMPLWYLMFLYTRAQLRKKYPLPGMGNDFHIVEESGVLYVLDMKAHEVRWVANLVTANDLHFALYREGFMTKFYPYPKKPNKKDLKDFKIMEEIRTRGRPGA